MIKKLSLLVIALSLLGVSFASVASHSVKGYYRSNGTYVERHKSMDPGESKETGYSYKNDELVPRDTSKDTDYSF